MSRFERITSFLKKEKPRERRLYLTLHDIRGMSEEELRGRDPGLYIVIGPVTPYEVEYTDFLTNVAPYLLGFVRKESASSHDKKKSMSVWEFRPEQYWEHDDMISLIMRAHPDDLGVLNNMPVFDGDNQQRPQVLIPRPL